MTTARDGRSGLLALAGLCVVVVAAGAVWMRGGSGAGAVVASASKPRPEKLEVYYGGCHEVHVGPVCLITETSTITLWMEDPGFVPTVRVDGAVVPARVAEVDGGVQLKVRVAPGVGRISVGEGEVRQAWELRLGAAPDATALEVVSSLRRVDPITALEKTHHLESNSDAHLRAAARSIRARIERDLGRPTWVETARSSIELHRSNGCITGTADDLAFISYRLIEDGALQDAKSALSSLDEIGRGIARQRIAHESFSALAEVYGGNPRRALNSLKDVYKWSERIDDDQYRPTAIDINLILLSLVSRFHDASSLLQELHETIRNTKAPCERARLLNNFAWFGREIDLTRSIGAARSAQRIHESECHAPASSKFLLLLTLGRLLLLDGQIAEAERLVNNIRLDQTDGVPAGLIVWLDELEAELRLSNRQPSQALELFQRVQSASSLQVEPNRYWRSSLGLARASRSLGDVERALESLELAERSLDRLILEVPLGEGRTLFAQSYVASTVELIEILIQERRISKALLIAMRSNRRHSNVLALASRISALPKTLRIEWETRVQAFRDAKKHLASTVSERWALSRVEQVALDARVARSEADLARTMEGLLALLRINLDQAPPKLGPMEASIVVHPSPRGSFLFYSDRDALLVSEFSVEDGRIELGSEARQHLVASLADVDRVRVSLYDGLPGIEFQDFLEDITSRNLVVTYSFGLELLSQRVVANRALLVADPDGSLPRSRDEAYMAYARLATNGWDVTLLEGIDATKERVIDELGSGRFRLFHFAGHSDTHGIDGWRSYLRLSEGQRLEVVDVFALSTVPPAIVLSSCRSAGASESPVGVAQAFLARGAEIVLATTAAVSDDQARAVIQRVYSDESGASLAEKLASAQWALREEGVLDSAVFRAYVR